MPARPAPQGRRRRVPAGPPVTDLAGCVSHLAAGQFAVVDQHRPADDGYRPLGQEFAVAVIGHGASMR